MGLEGGEGLLSGLEAIRKGPCGLHLPAEEGEDVLRPRGHGLPAPLLLPLLRGELVLGKGLRPEGFQVDHPCLLQGLEKLPGPALGPGQD